MKPAEVDGIPLSWVRLVEGRPPLGLGLFVPTDPNAVLEDFDEDEFIATDERMPYFATLWPAAEVLAREVMAGPSLAGQRVLDLGCGVGAAGLAAARRGARVSFLDWEPRALPIVARSLSALGLTAENMVTADWRQPPDLGRFDRILAADVLYEERNLVAVAAFLRDHMQVGAVAWIADPGRVTARKFPALLAAHSLAQQSRRTPPHPSEGPSVHLLEIIRPEPVAHPR